MAAAGRRGGGDALMPLIAQVTVDATQFAFWAALLALLTGILILIFPRVLNYIVAIYLIIVGVLGLIPFIQDAFN
jgi:hypothetical protein